MEEGSQGAGQRRPQEVNQTLMTGWESWARNLKEAGFHPGTGQVLLPSWALGDTDRAGSAKGGRNRAALYGCDLQHSNVPSSFFFVRMNGNCLFKMVHLERSRLQVDGC